MTHQIQRGGAPPPDVGPAPEISCFQATEHPQGTAPARLDDAELLAEVHRLVYVALGVSPVRVTVSWVGGGGVITRDRPESRLPVVGSPQWWEATEPQRVASLLVLAEGYLLADPEQQVLARLKAAAVAISEGIRQQRELVRHRRDVIGRALWDGDAARAIALTKHHASDQWWIEHPLDAVTT